MHLRWAASDMLAALSSTVPVKAWQHPMMAMQWDTSAAALLCGDAPTICSTAPSGSARCVYAWKRETAARR